MEERVVGARRLWEGGTAQGRRGRGAEGPGRPRSICPGGGGEVSAGRGPAQFQQVPFKQCGLVFQSL